MPRTLYLLRHGKSDGSAQTADHERPLSARGEAAAGLVGRFLSAAGEAPDLIVSSSAVRARRTAQLAATAGNWKAPVELHRELYLPDAQQVLALLRQLDRPAQRVLVTCHQPFCSQMVALLTGAVVGFPTAALARIELDIGGWAALAGDQGVLHWLMTPEAIAAARDSG